MNSKRLCMGCMSDKGDASLCSVCGWQEGTPPDSPAQLAPRSVLIEKYLLGRVLGQGGFGITYLAWDLLLNRKLAIKEYFPREICSRARNEHTVQPLSIRSREDFQYGLSKFVEEGQNLARFRDYPGIVSLLEFFETNGTAYIVMAYMEGMTFKQYLETQGGKIRFEAALDILIPVMDALREVHRVGMLHRDISPDNIYLNQDRQVKILDFGATRYAMREQSHGLTVLFKPGYAPLEQYSSGGKQGPWTDVYAVGATLYRAMSGKAPSESPDRLANEDLVSPSALGINIPRKSEVALLKALAVHYQDRFQSIQEFQDAVVPKPSIPGITDQEQPPSPLYKGAWMVAACALLLATLAFAGLWYSAYTQLKSMNPPDRQHSLHQPVESSGLRAQLDEANKNLQKSAQELSRLGNELAETQKQLTVSNTDRVDLQNQVKGLTASLQGAQQEIEELKRVSRNAGHPVEAQGQRLTIAYLELYAYDRLGNTRNGPTTRFNSMATQRVLCALGGNNPMQGSQPFSGKIEVVFIAPNGTVKTRVQLSVSATASEALWTAIAYWGADQPGTLERGTWQVEVLSDSTKLVAQPFVVY